MSAGRKSHDWEAIEREYRAGQLSVVEIGRQHGLSHTAINKRAKRDDWKRDLTERVRKEVSSRLVSPEVSEATAREAVELAAERGVLLVRQHRASLKKANTAIDRLLEELESHTVNIDEITDAIDEETAGDKDGKRRAMMHRAVSLGSRANAAVALSSALRNVIPLERQAFNLDQPSDDDGKIQIVISPDDAAL